MLTPIVLRLVDYPPVFEEEAEYCATEEKPRGCHDFETCLFNAKTAEEQRACGNAQRLQRLRPGRGCRACEISANEPMPVGLVVFPLAALARRIARRR